MYSHCVLDTWKILFFGKEKFFEKMKSKVEIDVVGRDERIGIFIYDLYGTRG